MIPENKTYLNLLAALVPGLNQVLDRNFKNGFNNLLLGMGLSLIFVFRYEKIKDCLISNDIELISGSLFFISIFCLVWIRSFHYALKGSSIKKTKHEGKGKFKYATKRFLANNLAVVASYVLFVLFIIVFLAPILAPFDPYAISDVVHTRYQPPSSIHPFGTDALGRDLLSRALFGGRISLSIGIIAVLISMTLGTIYGAIAGYYGGLIDNVLMRIVDVIIAFPIFFLMLMLVGVFNANILVLILILGLTSWPGTARYIRGEILSLRERPFIESARVIGLPARYIIWRHLIPNALSPVLVSAALMVGGMITAEAGLSFLGIGIQPPIPSWGNMIGEGQQAVFTGWWIAFFPGLLLTITILCLNLLADGLRDALDTKTLMRKYI